MPQSMEGKPTSQNDSAVDGHSDGPPPPMKDYKPAKLNPNSADRFQSHQAEYEARGKCTKGLIERVRRHNAANPQLRDELDKRETLRKVKAFKAVKNACACDACLKIKKTSLKTSRQQSRNLGSRSYRRITKCETENISVVSSASTGCCERCRKLGLNSDPLAAKKLIIKDSNQDLQRRFLNNPKKFTSYGAGCKSMIKRRKRHNAVYFNDKIKKSETKDDADSEGSGSTVNKKFRTSDGSRAHSVATEPSIPSYNSSISLGLQSEPMV